jgi:hypothetical protein
MRSDPCAPPTYGQEAPTQHAVCQKLQSAKIAKNHGTQNMQQVLLTPCDTTVRETCAKISRHAKHAASFAQEPGRARSSQVGRGRGDGWRWRRERATGIYPAYAAEPLSHLCLRQRLLPPLLLLLLGGHELGVVERRCACCGYVGHAAPSRLLFYGACAYAWALSHGPPLARGLSGDTRGDVVLRSARRAVFTCAQAPPAHPRPSAPATPALPGPQHASNAPSPLPAPLASAARGAAPRRRRRAVAAAAAAFVVQARLQLRRAHLAAQ